MTTDDRKIRISVSEGVLLRRGDREQRKELLILCFISFCRTCLKFTVILAMDKSLPVAMTTDTNFFYNTMLAKALVQLIPNNEKPPLRAWFSRLMELDKNDPKKVEMRDEYMWFILMMLQCQKIREPFNKPPPVDLEPLRDLMDNHVYEEVLVANGANMTMPDMSILDQEAEKSEPDKYKVSAPANFLTNQPVPHEGVICYVAAFSDQRYP